MLIPSILFHRLLDDGTRGPIDAETFGIGKSGYQQPAQSVTLPCCDRNFDPTLSLYT